MKKNGKERVIRRKERGITLVALVITILMASAPVAPINLGYIIKGYI